ncbi:hypothetical protein FQZ97_726930 [compost metagenome]
MQRRGVGQSQPADLAAVDQGLQGAHHFVGLQQRVGPMQEKAIQVLDTQALQGVVDRLRQVGRPAVVVLDLPARGVQRRRHDIGLADQLQLAAQLRAQAQGRAEVRFALAHAVDIGVIESIQALLDAAFDKAQQGLWRGQFGIVEQAHHAEQQGLLDRWLIHAGGFQ